VTVREPSEKWGRAVTRYSALPTILQHKIADAYKPYHDGNDDHFYDKCADNLEAAINAHFGELIVSLTQEADAYDEAMRADTIMEELG